MEQCKGLIAGIDIGYSKIQASVYSYNSRNVQTVKLTEDSKEKTSLANVVAECMRATGTSQIQSICVTIPDYHLMKYLLSGILLKNVVYQMADGRY